MTDTADEIRSIIERVETLAAEKQDIADQIKDVLAEAKGRGYNVTILREIIKLRKKSPDDRAEADAILDLYKTALGM